MAVVYIHKRLDNGDVFYVGAGRSSSRAFDLKSRNKYWRNIVNKHGHEVCITHDDICIEEAFSIEKYLISFYGRIDLKTGTLVNLTDGGEGTINKSKESIEKQLNTAKKNGTYEEMCERIKRVSKRDRSGINSLVRKDVYVYNMNGDFVSHYITRSSFADKVGSNCSKVSHVIDTGYQVKRHFVFSKYMGEKLHPDQYKICDLSKRGKKNSPKKGISLMEISTGKIIKFNSYREASLFLGRLKYFVSQCIRFKRFIQGDYKIILN